ncbi:MAG: DUF4173 domain-containing protein [Actinobacteria bacterium]|nr:DUF4173 domain-containing protein [Actinomycetota bacterium]MBW3649157.1 DUF4173 domain-containing protein [Actinomycetota bacterium]
MSLTDERQPGPQQWTGWVDLGCLRPPDRRVVAAVVAGAVGTDLALRSDVTGLAGGLLPALVAVGLLASGRVVNGRARPVLALAPLFGLWLAVRVSPWLLPLDVLAAAALLALGASLARRGDPTDLSIPDLCGRALHTLAHGVLAPGFLLGGLSQRRSAGPSATGAVVRGCLLAAPLISLLALLLGSADPVFASFFRLPTSGTDVFAHLVFLAMGAVGVAGLLRMASAPPFELPAGGGPRPLGAVEATTVLGALVGLFGAFTATQVLAVVGGAGYVARTAGLSYADYARSGFFQLLAVAAITLGVLVVLRAATSLDSANHRRRFLVLGEVAVALTLVIVAGAVRRLWLYEQAYGLTMLRLCSTLFALWIGAVFVLLAASLGGTGARRAWLAPAAGSLALAGLLITNVVNPEAVVVRRNVERFGSSPELDARYLVELSDDAVPELVRSLPRLDPESAAFVRDAVCSGEREPGGGLWGYNASRRAALEARRAACPGPEA